MRETFRFLEYDATIVAPFLRTVNAGRRRTLGRDWRRLTQRSDAFGGFGPAAATLWVLRLRRRSPSVVVSRPKALETRQLSNRHRGWRGFTSE
jgi:hypothetical protein